MGQRCVNGSNRLVSAGEHMQSTARHAGSGPFSNIDASFRSSRAGDPNDSKRSIPSNDHSQQAKWTSSPPLRFICCVSLRSYLLFQLLDVLLQLGLQAYSLANNLEGLCFVAVPAKYTATRDRNSSSVQQSYERGGSSRQKGFAFRKWKHLGRR